MEQSISPAEEPGLRDSTRVMPVMMANSYYHRRAQPLLPTASTFTVNIHQHRYFGSIYQVMSLNREVSQHALRSPSFVVRGGGTRISFLEVGTHAPLGSQPQVSITNSEAPPGAPGPTTVGRSPGRAVSVDGLPIIRVHSATKRSVSFLKRITHPAYSTPPPLPPSAIALLCEGSCAARSYPPTSLAGFDSYELGKGVLVPTVVLLLPITLPTHDTTPPKTTAIPIKRMDLGVKGSVSRSSLSKFFKRSASLGSGSSDPQTESASNGPKSLMSIFTKDSITGHGKASPSRGARLNSSTPPSPQALTTHTTPTTPAITPTISDTPTTPAAPAITPATPDIPDITTIPTIPTTPTTPGTPSSTNNIDVIIGETPEPTTSIWEEDTEDEEEQNTFRIRMRTRIANGFKPKGRVPSAHSEYFDPEGDKEVEPPAVQAGLTKELQHIPGSNIPVTVFGRNISYEVIDDQQPTEPTRTFTHFPKLDRNYIHPTGNEVLHIRDGGYEYLTLERINGVTCITAGALECLAAELAYPLLARHDYPKFFESMIFCGSMFAGNATMLEMLFHQLKNSAGKSIQQMNIIHFVMHWIQEKPEDFSWCAGILELRFQIFRYLLDIFRQTGLAQILSNISIKHHKLESAYKDFAKTQKEGWVSFDDIVISYARPTKCGLVSTGLSNISVEDLTNYMAIIDLILFRDGSEMSTLDEYWKEKVYLHSPRQYLVNEYFSERQVPVWWPVERVERLVQRAKMVKHWVALEILQLDTLASRTQMIKVFISVAGNLLQMSDFQGAFCIVEGLECPLVRQLERSWEDIGYLHLRLFKQLREFVNDKSIYDGYLKKPSDDPVTPYYIYFLEEVTALHDEKDHFGRVKSTGTTKIHRDASLNEFGTWDTTGENPLRAEPRGGISQVPVSVDLQKYRKLLTTIQGYQERAKPNYQHSGEITTACFALRLHLVGMNTFSTLADMENLTPPEYRGRLNEMSHLVETRILEAWSLQPETDIPAVFRDEDALRCIVLQKLYTALGLGV